MRASLFGVLAVLLTLTSCKHPLQVAGRGEIIDRLGTGRGCDWQESRDGAERCLDNAVSNGAYRVNYDPIPESGWRFSHWEGPACPRDSKPPRCEFDFDASTVAQFNQQFPGFELAPIVAVFTPDTDQDNDGTGDAEDAFPVDPTRQDSGDHGTIMLSHNIQAYRGHGVVEMNGAVTVDKGEVRILQWDWGDGNKTIGFFPQRHCYVEDGTYTVATTAFVASGRSRTVSSPVTISNSTRDGCQSRVDDVYMQTPFTLHLLPGENSPAPLALQTVQGNAPGAINRVSNTAPELVSVGDDGVVRALRAESDGDIGALIQRFTSSGFTANSTVVRVLNELPQAQYTTAEGEHVIFSYPATVQGIELSASFERQQALSLTDAAYRAQQQLIGLQPFQGAPQIIAVDFGDSEQNRVCGISGNPVRLGWNIEDDAQRNCFMDPFSAEQRLQWFVILHELGHNFTFASPLFLSLFHTPDYIEGLATAMAMESTARLLDAASEDMTEPARRSLGAAYRSSRDRFNEALARYLALAPENRRLDADVVDGIWQHWSRQNSNDLAERFFYLLQPQFAADRRMIELALRSLQAGSRGPHSIFAAWVSAAFGKNLHREFTAEYRLSLDHELYRDALELAQDILR